MTPTHANKKGARYRYYVSQSLTTSPESDAPRRRRLPASDLERIVVHRLRQFLASESELYAILESQVEAPDERMRQIRAATKLASAWDSLEPGVQRARVRSLVSRIDVDPESLAITIDRGRLPQWLTKDETESGKSLPSLPQGVRSRPAQHRSVLTLSVAVRLKRAGMETRLLIQGQDTDARTAPDRSLHRLLAKAERYRVLMMENSDKPLGELAAEVGVCTSHFSRVLRLSFIAPDIVKAALQNRHPVDLNAERLAKRTDLPLDWDEQRKLFGLD